MEWRRREEDHVRTGVVSPSATEFTGGLRTRNASFDRDSIADLPLGNALAYLEDLTGRFMARSTLTRLGFYDRSEE